jgi:DNA-binding MarR family transcriptional regulator
MRLLQPAQGRARGDAVLRRHAGAERGAATQFTVLVAVSLSEQLSLSQIAERLVMDRTTLTRNVHPLERDGLVRIEHGPDRRERYMRLTVAGTQEARPGHAPAAAGAGARDGKTRRRRMARAARRVARNHVLRARGDIIIRLR